MKRAIWILFLLFFLLPGCGEAFSLACDLAGYHLVEVGPRVEPTGSAVVPFPPRPLRPPPGQRPQ